jgi:hypothetical protein
VATTAIFPFFDIRIAESTRSPSRVFIEDALEPTMSRHRFALLIIAAATAALGKMLAFFGPGISAVWPRVAFADIRFAS